MNKEKSHLELVAWLQLARTPNIGPITFAALLKLYKTPEVALQALPGIARNAKAKSFKLCSVHIVEQEIELAAKKKATIVTLDDERYPKFLRGISDAPPVVTFMGDASLLQRQSIAIVGGRNASMNGMNFARGLSHDLGVAGFVSVSGLARGIDTAVHSAVLYNYPTIAVMGSGIDIVYPYENMKLYEQIAYNGGLVMTELAMGVRPKPSFFPQRNRIISGLSLGVFIIEASHRSGSLITANFALSQGREVLAVPGSPADARCSGSNALIKNGAKLVESVQDIIDCINFNNNDFDNNSLFDNRSDGIDHVDPIQMSSVIRGAKEMILQHLDSVPVDIDALIVATNLRVELVLVALLELELAGRIDRHVGNKVSLRFECSPMILNI